MSQKQEGESGRLERLQAILAEIRHCSLDLEKRIARLLQPEMEETAG